MKTLAWLETGIPRRALKLLVVVAVPAAVALLTHEPGAVAAAFATTVAALDHGRPVWSCLRR